MTYGELAEHLDRVLEDLQECQSALEQSKFATHRADAETISDFIDAIYEMNQRFTRPAWEVV
jgi:hypothetical protein